MRTNIFIIFFTFLSLAAHTSAAAESYNSGARQKVILVSSFESAHNQAIWRGPKWDIETKIKNIFLREFKNTDYELEVISDADKFQLWSALSQPNAVAVLWASHADGHANQNVDGLSTSGILLDRNRDNVIDVLRLVPPNLKWLSVIGCNSESALQGYSIAAKLDVFSTKINGIKNFKSSIKRAKQYLATHTETTNYTCPTRKGVRVRLTRTFDDQGPEQPFSPAATVKAGNHIIGVFEKQNDHTAQIIETYLSIETLKPGKSVSLVLDSGAMSFRAQNVNLGRLVIEVEDTPTQWTRFENKNGEPIGFSSHVYSGKFLEAVDTSVKSFSDYACYLNGQM